MLLYTHNVLIVLFWNDLLQPRNATAAVRQTAVWGNA